MRFYKLITIFFLALTFSGFSQNSELGLFLGTSYYLGELNPTTPILNEVSPAIGLFYRKNSSKRYALRFGVNYAKLSASDENNFTELSQLRKLSFSSDLLEAYGLLEFNFLPYQINNSKTTNFTPYVFIGVAAFYANPSVEGASINVSGEDVFAPSIPFGLGVKFNISGNLGAAVEWNMRKTITDQIDGLPESYVQEYQLSNTQNDDWYSSVGITLNYKFLTKRDHCNMPGI